MSYFGSIYADQELSHRAKTVYMYLRTAPTPTTPAGWRPQDR